MARQGTCCFCSRQTEIVFDSLGHLRLVLGEKLGLIDKNTYEILWVTEFPLFERDREENRWVAKHHPFTSPMDEDITDILTLIPAESEQRLMILC